MDNVSTISYLIGKEILNEKELSQLKIAAMLHDIGKYKIPQSILYKPGRLDIGERIIMKKHSKIGADELAHIGLNKLIIEAVLHHHERYDGAGYPMGLKGEKIPLYARIISVADAFDAMTSKRPYNIPKSSKEALDDIWRNAGTQFDPGIVKIFCNLDRKPLTMDKLCNII